LKSLENKVVLSWKIMENHSQISVQTLYKAIVVSVGIYASDMENDNKDCTKVEHFPSVMLV